MDDSATKNQPMMALVEYQVRADVCNTAQWLDLWEPRAQAALHDEAETTAYEALVADEDDSRVLVFERYAKGAASLATHVEHPSHKQLLATMGERNLTKRRIMSNLFTDIEGYGWWGRPEQNSQLSVEGLQLVVFGTRFSSPDMLERYLDVTSEHADYCWDAEPRTLIYSGGIAQRDADRGPDIVQGDLVFVVAFADEAAAIQHRDDPRHIALQPKLQDIGRERMFWQTYRASGKGFLWNLS